MLRKLLACATSLACISIISVAFGSNGAIELSNLPNQAQSSISAILGSDMPQYHARKRPDGYETENLTQGLRNRYTASGVDTQIGQHHWRMNLQGYSYGKKLYFPNRVLPTAKSNRVEYKRGILTEWYTNGPTGLEQGFTITRRPGRVDGKLLRVTFSLSGDLTPLTVSGNAVCLVAKNGECVLRYADVTAMDASGEKLESSITLDNRTLSLEVNDSSAQYPLTIDPIIQRYTLSASGGANGDYFGDSVAIDGNTIVVGAPGYSGATGAAFVFVKPKRGWENMTQTAKLTPSNGAVNDGFGVAVSISTNTIVVGSSTASVNGNEAQGAAYVFVEPSGGWKDMTETAKLTASDGTVGAEFGTGVAINGDSLVVGSPSGGVGNYNPGTAYIFVEPHGGWMDMTQTAELSPSDGSDYNEFGCSVSISGDTVLIGAFGTGNDTGTAYVFVQPQDGWVNMTETAELTASDQIATNEFGVSVSLGGNTAAIGASGNNLGDGAVYVYVEPSTGWLDMTQTAKLTASKAKGLGSSVSLNEQAIISGAPNNSPSHEGAAYVFVRPSGGWRNASKPSLMLSVPFNDGWDYFGDSVSLSGMTAIVGAYSAPTSPPCSPYCQAGPGESFVFVDK
jgi:uncharacterized protein (DUF2345 family)